jgi:pimeloyl-ACP methyl ester carboxylesterase
MAILAARGAEIAWNERGEGAPVLLIHETAASSDAWVAMSEAISDRARAISYDRRGWGGSTAPEGYRRTTVEEQSEDAAALIEALDPGPVVPIGAGAGAVIALDLLLRRPELLAATVLIEPPLLQLLPVATEALSDDRRRLEAATASGESVIDLYLSGGLPAFGPGVARLPNEVRSAARDHPASVVAELGLAAGWRVPLPRLAHVDLPSAIVTARSTPPILREASSALAGRLGGSSATELDERELPPHLGAPAEVAAIVAELVPRGSGPRTGL